MRVIGASVLAAVLLIGCGNSSPPGQSPDGGSGGWLHALQ
jgi:hypothetical protein